MISVEYDASLLSLVWTELHSNVCMGVLNPLFPAFDLNTAAVAPEGPHWEMPQRKCVRVCVSDAS